MNRAFNKLRLFFCTFSGEDDYIIRQCVPSIQISFASIGVFVLIVFIGCWASASLFMSHLFEGSIITSAFAGIIWAMLVTNLYLLLLYTISPALLPVARHTKGKKVGLKGVKSEEIIKPETAFTWSFIFRLSLIMLLSIIITQPFNVLIFSPSFEASHQYANEIKRILSHEKLSWLVTIGGGIIFLLPIYLKYAIRNSSGFYEKKRHIENKFVHDNYLEFKEVYSAIFNDKILRYNRQTWENLMPYLNKLEKINTVTFKLQFEILTSEIINEPISKFEYWADSPFRTTHKKVIRHLASEADLLKIIYPDNI